MRYTDRLYNSHNITEQVIIDLINSDALRRLKGIDQAGYFEVYLPNTKHTRFEHSLGVYLLLKTYNAPIEEQIAGLIHDVSHSAFSHCIDYVFGEDKQKTHIYQDNMFTEFVNNSDIPTILNKHSFNVSYILNEHNFPLKEQDLPDLCADRIDYSLRTALIYRVIAKTEVSYYLSHLTTSNNQWVFDSYEAANKYAELFRFLNHTYYSGLPSITMFYTVGQYIKYALEKQYISWKKLYTTDALVLRTINSHLSTDTKLNILWKRMNNKSKVINDPKHYESRVYCKSRLVDPLYIEGNKIYRLSDRHKEWKTILQTERKPKEYCLRFED